MTLPEGYAVVESGDTRAFAIPGAEGWLREALATAGTLHAWAGGQEGASTFAGRGVVYSIPAPTQGPDGRARWAVRHYRRGGAVAPLLGDRYVAGRVPRPWVEAAASAVARARGIPTPAVVAGAVYAAGPFYRADLATEVLPHAKELAELLFGTRDGRGGREGEDVAALEAAGRLIVRMETAGIDHPDLNARNLLVTTEGTAPELHLLDLDRCRVAEAGQPLVPGAMRARLRRSLEKLGARAGRPLGAEAWAALARGLEEGS